MSPEEGSGTIRKIASGKVREIYELDSERLLMVTSDRISAYDVVMTQAIPDKGKVLTAMSLFWFDHCSDICPNHLLSASAADLPAEMLTGDIPGRFMIVRKLQMLPVEFVVRGYLAGSGWKDYQATGAVCGIPIPPGLKESEKLPEPILTPATKATEGHDENISQDQAAGLAGKDNFSKAAEYSLALYKKAADHAAARGIILADTKFEFGLDDGQVVVADEVLTPDSSRFWPADQHQPGKSPPSFDKQFLRDWLDTQGWNHQPPPPDLPYEVVGRTRDKYIEAYELITGLSFNDYLTESVGH